jgi:hypothetical protein
VNKVEIPPEIVAEVLAEANGEPHRTKGPDKEGREKKTKRLDGHLEGVTRNLFQVLTEAKRRQDYALVLQVSERLIQIAELQARRLEALGGEGYKL